MCQPFAASHHTCELLQIVFLKCLTTPTYETIDMCNNDNDIIAVVVWGCMYHATDPEKDNAYACQFIFSMQPEWSIVVRWGSGTDLTQQCFDTGTMSVGTHTSCIKYFKRKVEFSVACMIIIICSDLTGNSGSRVRALYLQWQSWSHHIKLNMMRHMYDQYSDLHNAWSACIYVHFGHLLLNYYKNRFSRSC